MLQHLRCADHLAVPADPTVPPNEARTQNAIQDRPLSVSSVYIWVTDFANGTYGTVEITQPKCTLSNARHPILFSLIVKDSKSEELILKRPSLTEVLIRPEAYILNYYMWAMSIASREIVQLILSAQCSFGSVRP